MHLPTQWTLTLIHPDGKAESYPAQDPHVLRTGSLYGDHEAPYQGYLPWPCIQK